MERTLAVLVGRGGQGRRRGATAAVFKRPQALCRTPWCGKLVKLALPLVKTQNRNPPDRNPLLSPLAPGKNEQARSQPGHHLCLGIPSCDARRREWADAPDRGDWITGELDDPDAREEKQPAA